MFLVNRDKDMDFIISFFFTQAAFKSSISRPTCSHWKLHGTKHSRVKWLLDYMFWLHKMQLRGTLGGRGWPAFRGDIYQTRSDRSITEFSLTVGGTQLLLSSALFCPVSTLLIFSPLLISPTLSSSPPHFVRIFSISLYPFPFSWFLITEYNNIIVEISQPYTYII